MAGANKGGDGAIDRAEGVAPQERGEDVEEVPERRRHGDVRAAGEAELEAEVERLRNELEHARQQVVEAVDEVERRHRLDLVPLRQSVAIFGERLRFPEV